MDTVKLVFATEQNKSKMQNKLQIKAQT